MTSLPWTSDASPWRNIQPPSFPEPRPYTRCFCEENAFLVVQHLARFAHLENQVIQRLKYRGKKKRSDTTGVSSSFGASKLDARATHAFLPVWDVKAIFVSNSDKTVLLWEQCASRAPIEERLPVVWDYHVFVALTCTLVPVGSIVGCGDPDKGAGQHSPHVHQQRGSPAGQQLQSRTWIYDPDSRLSYTSAAAALPDSSEVPQPVLLSDYLEGTFDSALVLADRIPPHLRTCARIVEAKELLAHFASDRSHMRIGAPSNQAGSEAGSWSSPPPPWPPLVGHAARAAKVTNNLMDRFVSMSKSVPPLLSSPASPSAAASWYGEVLDDLTFFSSSWTVAVRPGATVECPEIAKLASASKAPAAPTPLAKIGFRHGMRRALSLPSRRKAHRSLPAARAPPNEPLPPLPGHSTNAAPTASSIGTSITSSPLHSLAREDRTHYRRASPSSRAAVSWADCKAASYPIRPESGKRGGRVSSPFFPAYLAASSASRAERPREPPPPPSSSSLSFRPPQTSGDEIQKENLLALPCPAMARSVSLDARMSDLHEPTRR